MEVGACLFVIFGATGDLTQRKLMPALFRLMQAGRIGDRSRILGIGRDTGLDDAGFRAQAGEALAARDAGAGDAGAGDGAARWCERTLFYQSVAGQDPAAYAALAARIDELQGPLAGAPESALPNRVFYLALPPAAFAPTVAALGAAGLNRGGQDGWTRIVVEKPFGHDLASAQALNALLHRHFDESQIYRIDHYLGKETVQNLLAFRFGNALFESAWNRERISSVAIVVAERMGVEQRAGYYDHAGALRDMVQNHLTQLLTLIAMEVPAEFQADSIRFEKVKVLRAAAPIGGDALVLGQYGEGESNGSGAALRAYLDEPGVAAGSRTETFVALRLALENWRWQGVPFYLLTGKRLARQVTEITIRFRSPPVALFRSLDGCATHSNVLTIRLQPAEGFTLSFEVKSPGERFTLRTQQMDFRYAQAFGTRPADGYDTLLLDIVQGDQTLFVHADEAEASWRLYGPLLHGRHRLHPYPAGSGGPQAAQRLIEDSTQLPC